MFYKKNCGNNLIYNTTIDRVQYHAALAVTGAIKGIINPLQLFVEKCQFSNQTTNN